MLLRLFGPVTALALRGLGARRRRERIGRLSLVVYELGPEDGEPWVLLHGMGSTALSWAPIARALRRDCRLLVPELSALGGTRGPRPALDVGEGAAAVAELIRRRVRGGRATVAGISLGGWIATRLALAHPELAERLLLVNCAGYLNQDWNRIRELVRVRGIDDVDRLCGALFHRPQPWVRFARRGFLAAYRSPAVRAVLDSIRPEDAFGEPELRGLEIPCGLIWSEHDALFTLEVGRAMAAALPYSRLFAVPDCGHAVQWECPRALLRALDAFRGWTPRAERLACHSEP